MQRMSARPAAAATPGHDRWELRIGAHVDASDLPLGTLKQVVVVPAEQRVSEIIVHADLLPPRDLLFALSDVVEADDERVVLGLTSEEAAARAPFKNWMFHAAPRPMLDYGVGEALISLLGSPRSKRR